MRYAEMDLLDIIDLFEARLRESRAKAISDHNAGITVRECGLVLDRLYELREIRLENEQLKEERRLLLENLGAGHEQEKKLE